MHSSLTSQFKVCKMKAFKATNHLDNLQNVLWPFQQNLSEIK